MGVYSRYAKSFCFLDNPEEQSFPSSNLFFFRQVRFYEGMLNTTAKMIYLDKVEEKRRCE